MTVKLKEFFIFLLVIHFPIISFAYNDAVHRPATANVVSLFGLESYLEKNLGIRTTDTFTSDIFPTCPEENCIKNKPTSATGNFRYLIVEGATREDRPAYTRNFGDVDT